MKLRHKIQYDPHRLRPWLVRERTDWGWAILSSHATRNEVRDELRFCRQLRINP